ncbi:hypothetical protein CC1G_11405 [Coprinopsis cinerea okayama7|uniref:Uncharacterized protein n=1 Tax=Coprinopsis cinerea (strain Okayama-7 / 130 / ATCC MYA-4618 / FGSC 9003) TaxID=240176 RepID=A8N474_COPC7|nr:hypothetical protein CC1G_11405 [Coprinopsis cinerea okayama7\|eukprot:XP_001829669.2 hypothetical protein CC1G_11405 [Coprinopsis cinerea okayama7\
MATSATADPFELQQRLVASSSSKTGNVTPFSPSEDPLASLPPTLHRAHLRMEFPPSYALVGVYRLFTDKSLWKPAWEKCRNGTRRGLIVGLVWVFLTWGIQKKFIEVFLSNSPRITGLSNDTVFGWKVPFSLHTYAALLYAADQLTWILSFFISKNMRIARDRAWDYTIASRNKGDDFWQPYVEEWDNPPVVDVGGSFMERLSKKVGGKIGLNILKRILLIPASLYPLLGPLVSAWFRALGTAEYLHRRYFKAKKMTDYEIAVFMEERKWDYRAFGFTAALLEGLPIIGLVFTISNRVGAAMWAFDLEKRQHFVREEKERKRLAADRQ